MVIQTQFYQAHLAKIVDQTSCIRTLFFQCPDDYPEFQPGRVVRVQLESTSGLNRIFEKPYCICSLPEDKHIELCIDRVNENGSSGHLYRLQPGASVTLSKPMGRFVFQKPHAESSLLFVGFGSGVGVLHGFLRQHYQTRSNQLVQFYAINSNETRIPYENTLEEASETYPYLEIYPILQTNGYDTDEVMDRILSHTEDTSRWQIYIAGPTQPVDGLQERLVEVGFSKDHIVSQGYR